MLALGMTNIDDTLPSPSTYYLFKQMVEEYNESKRKDLFGDLFRSLASSIAKCFDISGKQTRMDSKLFSSNIAKSTRLQLVIKSIQKWEKSNRNQVEKFSKENQEVLKKITTSQAENITYRMTKQEEAEMILKLGEVVKQLIDDQIGGDQNELMQRLFKEQFKQEQESGKISLTDTKQLDGNTMQSPHDQDAAYRLKINGQKKQRVRGFASNITETCDKENELQIITSVQTEKVTHSDTAFFQQAIENTEKIVGQIEEVTTDGAYNSPANKDYIEDREQTQWNLQSIQGKPGFYEHEWVDEDQLQVTNVKTEEVQLAVKTDKGEYRITEKDESGKKKYKFRYFKRITIDNYFRRQQIEEDKKYTTKIRANVESTIGHVFYNLNGQKSKYRGIERNHIYVLSRCMWVNFIRIMKKIEKDQEELVNILIIAMRTYVKGLRFILRNKKNLYCSTI